MNRLEERVRRLAEAMRSAPDDVTAQTALLHRVLVAELMAGLAPPRGCGAAGRRQVPRHEQRFRAVARALGRNAARC